ncbi:MAG TPA: family 1 glycosylhydrolase [Patescibacteria group bacterium]
MKKILFWIVATLLVIYGVLAIPVPRTPDQSVTWGLTFSQKMSEELGDDWRAAYEDIVLNLKPQRLRLVAYWDKIESQSGRYVWDDFDWQVKLAKENNIPVTIAIGKKAPRWPECHVPSWADSLASTDQQSAINSYLTAVISRYKAEPNIEYWQVENEPFIGFGACPTLSQSVLEQEVALVRQLDPTHKILLTDGGAWGKWIEPAKLADAFGTTLYTKVYRKGIGYTRPPFPAPYYSKKADIVRAATGQKDQPYIFTEIGLEPWGGKSIAEMSLEEQRSLHSLKDFRGTLEFARSTGFGTFYLWGGEWWHSLKFKGDDSYWREAQKVFASGRSNNPLADLPDSFLWGASTASHQVEGGTQNDWTEWEKVHANTLAAGATEKFSHQIPNWNAFASAATSPTNYISSDAADHYHRYAEDFSLAQSLGMNAQRISLEWARIEPKRDVFDAKELDHYRAVIADMKAKGMEPMVTLWHYTLPLWFRDAGGWENPESAKWFAEYSQKVVSELGGDVTFWITLNEPGVYSNNAYLLGTRPPQKQNPVAYLRVHKNLVQAHIQAYAAIKSVAANAQVGIAQDVYSYESNTGLVQQLIRPLAEQWTNYSFLDRLGTSKDFIGLNYYINVTLGGKSSRTGTSDLGWSLYPEGIYSVLKGMARYQVPLYVTESGLADASDTQRADYMASVIAQIAAARKDGVDVRGYFYWSLIDNFEWEKGFWPRFGLIAIDYTTQARMPRPSAFKYADLIAAYRATHQ